MYLVWPGFTTVDDVLVWLTVTVWVTVRDVLYEMLALIMPKFSPAENDLELVCVVVNVWVTVIDSVQVTGSDEVFVIRRTVPYGLNSSPWYVPKAYSS